MRNVLGGLGGGGGGGGGQEKYLEGPSSWQRSVLSIPDGKITSQGAPFSPENC